MITVDSGSSACGTELTWRDVRRESVMRSIADIDGAQPINYYFWQNVVSLRERYAG
jgi:hypothetical protein